MSHRRSAQLGLLAGALVLVSSMTVLMALSARPEATVATIDVGAPAPTFALRGVDGSAVSHADFEGKITVLFFASPRCPVCVDYTPRISALAAKYAHDERVRVVAINPGSASPEVRAEIRDHQERLGQAVRYLVDPDASVARRYAAEVTPTFYVIDRDGVIRYRGAFDDSRVPDDVGKHYVASALRSVLLGRPVEVAETQAQGCAIR